jgi:hypothetical protein
MPRDKVILRFEKLLLLRDSDLASNVLYDITDMGLQDILNLRVDKGIEHAEFITVYRQVRV